MAYFHSHERARKSKLGQELTLCAVIGRRIQTQKKHLRVLEGLKTCGFGSVSLMIRDCDTLQVIGF